MKHLRCARCRELQPADQYPVDMSKRSGHRGICHTCEPPVIKPPKPVIPEAIRQAMCTSKRRYRSQSFALSMAQRAAKRTRFLRVYHCPLCNGWHLTHKAEREASS